jgi:hypothetical protein
MIPAPARRALAAALLLVSACVNVDPKGPPPAAGGAPPPTHLAARKPMPEEKFATHAVPDSYFGVSTMRRGSLAVGLFVPFGVLANMAYVQAAAESAAGGVPEVLTLDLAASLREAVPEVAAGGPAPPRRIEVVPAATLVFMDDSQFAMTCFINARLVDGARSPWSARYAAAPESRFAVGEADLPRRVAADAKECLASAYDLYRRHVAGAFTGFRDYAIETDDFTLYMPLHQASLPGRVIGNDALGLNELRRSAVRGLTPR